MSNFREWLSDNLRYFMLIFGVLAVLVALFFGVKAISARISDDKSDDALSMDSVVEAVTQSTASAPEAASGAETVLVESVVENAAGAAGEALTADAASPVSVLMASYYEAIGNQDISAVRELVDILPETKAAEISSERLKYSDVKVYTKPGPDDGSYVVYTTYNYSGQDESSKLPGISQSYVAKDSDGAQKIIFSELDETTKEFIDSVAKDADVVELVSKVRDEYNAARTGREVPAVSGQPAEGTDASADASGSGDAFADTADSPDAGDDAAAPEEDGSGENYDADYDETDDGSDEADYEESSDEADNDDGSDEEEETEDDSSDEWTGEAVSAVNVRSGPGFDYEVISELYEGEQVTITGEESGWYHVVGDGVEGYVGHSWIK